MIIAIEGMDGSGKTSISKIVANKILNITLYRTGKIIENFAEKCENFD